MEDWLPDFEDEVKDNSTTSLDNSESLGDHLKNITENGISEEALEAIADSLDNLLDKRQNEIMNNDNINQSYYVKTMLENIDKIISSRPTWMRLQNELRGFQMNTKYLLGVEFIGKQHLDYFNESCKLILKQCSKFYT